MGGIDNFHAKKLKEIELSEESEKILEKWKKNTGRINKKALEIYKKEVPIFIDFAKIDRRK